MERNNSMPQSGQNRTQKLRRTLSGIKTGLSRSLSRTTSQASGSAIRNDFSKITPYRDEVGTELKSIDRSKDKMIIEHEISPTNQDGFNGFRTHYNPNIPPSTPRTPKSVSPFSPSIGSLRSSPSVRLPRNPRDVTTSPTSSPISPTRPPLVIRTDTETLARSNSLHPPRSSSLRRPSRGNLKSQWTPAGQLRHKASWLSDAASPAVVTPTDSVFGSTMYRKASVKYKTTGGPSRSHGRNNASDDSASSCYSAYSAVSTPLTSPGFSAYDYSTPTTPFSAVSAAAPPNETLIGFTSIPYSGKPSARVLYDKCPPAITHREVNAIFCRSNPLPQTPGFNSNQMPLNPVAIQAGCTIIPSSEFDARQESLGGIQYPFLRAFKKICSNDMNFEIDLYGKLAAAAPKGGCLVSFMLIPDGKQAKAEVDSGKGQFEKRVNCPNEVMWEGWASHLWLWCLEEERAAVMLATNLWLNETAHDGIEVNVAGYASDPQPRELLIPTKDLFANEEEPIIAMPDAVGLGLQMGDVVGKVVWDEDIGVCEPSVWDDDGFVWEDARYRGY